MSRLGNDGRHLVPVGRRLPPPPRFQHLEVKDGPPQPDGVTGLHHIALAYPTRRALADAYRRLKDAGWPLRQTADHGTHEAIYISIPTATTSS